MAASLLALAIPMTLSSRLLMAGGGSGAFALPDPLVVLTAAGQGGWDLQSDHKAAYRNGVTYFAWQDSAGHVKVATYTHAAATVSAAVTLATLTADTHTSPSIVIRPDGRILVFYTTHNDASMRRRVTTVPLDITSFSAEVDLDSQLGGAGYTYPTAFMLDDGSLWLFYRDRNAAGPIGYLTYSHSDDGGSTWAAGTHLMDNGGLFIYFKVGGSGSRIDILTSDGHPVSDAPTHLFHCYTTDGGVTWRKSDGSVISTARPFAPSDATEVYDGASGTGWALDTAIDPIGSPVLLWSQGTWSGGALDFVSAHWTGAAWVASTVAGEDGGAVSYGTAGAALNPADPRYVYLVRHDGSQWEAFRYGFDGTSWAMLEQLTSGSAEPALMPSAVVDGVPGLPIVWLRGTVTTEFVFSLAIEGTMR